MARLPLVGGDNGDWGTILNQFLAVAHNADGTIAPSNVTDKGGQVFNVKAYGAKGDGTTDDTSAIQSALNAAPSGGTVYMPAGIYITSAPLTVPPGVKFEGSIRTLWFPSEGGTQNGVLAPAAKIMASASFSGAAVVQVVDKDTGGYSAASGNQTLSGITVDGSQLPGGNTVDGFRSYGSVMGVTMENCAVGNVGGHGFETAYHTGSGEGYGFLNEIDMSHCVFDNCGLDGVHIVGTADSTFTACHSIAAGGNAWYVYDVGNSRFLGCKAEWSHIGWNVQWPNATGNIPRQTFVGCSTDYNTTDGFYLTGGQAGGFVLISGCDFHADGHGGSATAAGIHISGTAFPVTITGCGVFMDSTTTSGYGPAYGIAVDTSPDLVTVVNGYFQGSTAGWHTDSTGTVVVGSAVEISTGGTPTAPTAPTQQTMTPGTINSNGYIITTGRLATETPTQVGAYLGMGPAGDSPRVLLSGFNTNWEFDSDSGGNFRIYMPATTPAFKISNTNNVSIANGIQLGGASTTYSGSGAPSASLGNNGDYYLRSDTPGTANQRIYVKSAGAWAGIV